MRYLKLHETGLHPIYIRDDAVVVIRQSGNSSSLLIETDGGEPREIHVNEAPEDVAKLIGKVSPIGPSRPARKTAAKVSKKAARR